MNEDKEPMPTEEVDADAYIAALRAQLDQRAHEIAVRDALIVKLRSENATLVKTIDALSAQFAVADNGKTGLANESRL